MANIGESIAQTPMANRRRLSEQFREQLESMGQSLERCREILDPLPEELELAERLKDWSRWTD